MKPSTRRVLDQLRQGPQTTHSLLMAGCGSRYSARIHELRAAGFQISEERLPLPTHGSRYRLVGEPERALSETKDSIAREQADPESVPFSEAVTASEGVRSAAPAESHPGGSLFDASVFAERGGYENSEAA